MDTSSGPLAELGILGRQHVAVTELLDHHEVYTFDGLLTLLWHHSPQPTDAAVLYCGGAMGGLLGPADGLYHDLATMFAVNGAAAGVRVGYRVPNDLERCVFDTLAAAQLASQQGAVRFVVVGHSFGGAVAVQAGVALGEQCAGVVTLSTQSAGCEPGETLAEHDTPVLLLHGDHDQILPFLASQMVQMITGGELVVLAGADHLLTSAATELRDRLGSWIPARFGTGKPATSIALGRSGS